MFKSTVFFSFLSLPTVSVLRNLQTHAMPLKLAANLTMLFPETKTMSERFERARKSGFKNVESAFLFEPKERMKEAKQASGLEHVLMNGNPGKFFCIFIS